MLGLIKKDLLMIKGNLKIVFLMLFVFGMMSLQNGTNLSFVLIIISIMLFISTFSYDEYNKWDAYAITLPNGRKNVVKSKYIASIILTLISSVLTILISLVIYYFNKKIDIEEMLSVMIGSIFAVSLIQSVIYPLIFKFGVEKGRIGMFIGCFVVTAIIGTLMKNIDFSKSNNIISFFNDYFMIIMPVVSIIMIFISYKISEKIYMTKDF